jgi:hypothetical protein
MKSQNLKLSLNKTTITKLNDSVILKKMLNSRRDCDSVNGHCM